MFNQNTLPESEKIVLEWLKVVEQFCHLQLSLKQTPHIASTTQSQQITQYKAQLHQYRQMQEYAYNTVSTLLIDFNNKDQFTVCNKLQVHTALLKELNYKIETELSYDKSTTMVVS